MPAPTFQPRLVQHQTRIHQATRDRRRPLTNVMSWVLEPSNLEAAWRRVSTNDGAFTPGPDGVTCSDVAHRWQQWLGELSDELRRDTYRPAAPRWVHIPKHSNPALTRTLGILNLRDRVVLAALKQFLEPVVDPTFAATSFGFRPGRSVPGALAAATRAMSARGAQAPDYTVGVHVDVANCFDSLDHGLLLDVLARHVRDRRLLRLIRRLLHVGGRRSGWFWLQRRGVVQGSSLSPLLSNMYLHATDVAMLKLAEAKHDSLLTLRYADDLLILARDDATLRWGLRRLRQVLADWRLRLRNPRERLRRLRDGIDWLGVTIRPKHANSREFGYEIPAAKIASMRETIAELTSPGGRPSPGEVALWIEELNDRLRQWREAYSLADNSVDLFLALDDFARDCVGRMLSRATGLKGQALQQRRRRSNSHGWTWEIQGVRLLQLADLPPKNSRRLIRPPVWQRI